MRVPLAMLCGLLPWLAGCYLSYAELADEDADASGRDADAPRDDGAPRDADADVPPDGPPCRVDEECDDDDPCTTDRCSVAGLCTHQPAPFEEPAEHTSIGWPHGGAAVGREVWIVLGGYQLQRWDLDGPLEEPRELFDPGGERDWDMAVAATVSDVAVLTHVGGGLEWRLVGEPERVERTEPGGIFVDAAWTGRWLMAAGDWMDTCGLGWADATGRWVAGVEAIPGGCVRGYVPSGPSAMTGHPPDMRPAGYTAAGEAVLLSIAGDGTIHELTAGPEGWTVSEHRLSEPGPPYYHSLSAARGPTGFGAQWVQVEDEEADGKLIRFAVLDEADLQPLAAPLEEQVFGRTYVMQAAHLWCGGRHVGIWNDAHGSAVVQFTPDGRRLGETMRWGVDSDTARLRAVCLYGGVAVTTPSTITMLRCPAD
ncbi:MAG: hypothetical protein JXB32_00765 [Deltaproteobacteria bacterium]|nr:hypothetical protein [Deltaproteobacteria bacterium]